VSPGAKRVGANKANHDCETKDVTVARGQTARVDLTCISLPRIEGKVTVNGVGTQASVTLFEGVAPIAFVETDAGGNFAFPNVSPGAKRVGANKANHDCETKDVFLALGVTARVDLTCTPRPGAIVVTATVGGSPTPGVQVTITGPTGQSGTIGPDGTVTLTQTLPTGADGKATFSGLPPGTYDITAQGPGLSCQSTTATVQPGGTANVTTPCTPTTGTIIVRLRNSNGGSPIVGAPVRLRGPAPSTAISPPQSTDAQGMATFTVAPGSYDILVAATSLGFTCPPASTSVGPGGQVTTTVDCTSP